MEAQKFCINRLVSDISISPSGYAIDNIDHRFLGPLGRSFLARPFGRNANVRVVIFRTDGPISRSQIEPFFHYRADFHDRFGAEFRCRPMSDLLNARKIPEADIFLVQPWFTVEPKLLEKSLENLKNRLPDSRVIFLDSYAHNDLRLARIVDPYIDLYYKKSLFKNLTEYLTPYQGDTNIAEYYGKLCSIDVDPPVDWHVPETIFPKLRLGPNFLTHSRFTRAFELGRRPVRDGRTIDLQSRLGGGGKGWYPEMRRLAQKCAEQLDNVTLSPSGKLEIKAFMNELANSKICFSPFGYGELCWRDIEAFQAGSVLIKPSMNHLVTKPDLYDPGFTYLPIQWDFSDLEDVVQGALADEMRMDAITQEAWDRAARYIRDKDFVNDMADIFGKN